MSSNTLSNSNKRRSSCCRIMPAHNSKVRQRGRPHSLIAVTLSSPRSRPARLAPSLSARARCSTLTASLSRPASPRCPYPCASPSGTSPLNSALVGPTLSLWSIADLAARMTYNLNTLMPGLYRKLFDSRSCRRSWLPRRPKMRSWSRRDQRSDNWRPSGALNTVVSQRMARSGR